MPMKPIMIENRNGLSDEIIAERCPSVFATEKHESRSEKYERIPTSTVLAGMRNEGFAPTCVIQAKARTEGKANFTKHLIRFRNVGDLGSRSPEVFEFVLKNSHDGSSCYELMSGFFRFICANGMIVGDYGNPLKVTHSGDILRKVLSATFQIVEEAPGLMDTIEEMKHVPLTQEERLLLAEFAMKARFDDLDNGTVIEGSLTPAGDGGGSPLPPPAVSIYTPQDFLRIRRGADREHTLYNTLNVLQENCIRGGVTAYDARGDRHRTRAINEIDKTVKVNGLLWQFSERLLAMKQGH